MLPLYNLNKIPLSAPKAKASSAAEDRGLTIRVSARELIRATYVHHELARLPSSRLINQVNQLVNRPSTV